MGASNTARHQTTMGQPIVSSHTEQDSSLQDGLWNIRFIEAEFTLSDNWGYLDLEVNLNNISSAYRTSIDSCFWDFGDGFSEGIMFTDSTTCNTSHTYYLPDTTNIVDYYITFKVFDTAGNFDYEPDSVHLVRMVPGFNFSFQGNEDYHPDAIIDFENTSIDPEGIIDTLWCPGAHWWFSKRYVWRDCDLYLERCCSRFCRYGISIIGKGYPALHRRC